MLFLSERFPALLFNGRSRQQPLVGSLPEVNGVLGQSLPGGRSGGKEVGGAEDQERDGTGESEKI